MWIMILERRMLFHECQWIVPFRQCQPHVDEYRGLGFNCNQNIAVLFCYAVIWCTKYIHSNHELQSMNVTRSTRILPFFAVGYHLLHNIDLWIVIIIINNECRCWVCVTVIHMKFKVLFLLCWINSWHTSLQGGGGWPCLGIQMLYPPLYVMPIRWACSTTVSHI